ncbi:MAG: DNA-directed RNA polymerase subunit omega [Bacteroidales bacterium]|jgi:DNA-directed RNA polymerase subunit K/omega|nr:DNA-directed RNA polymerase subunit omega [Bacteroidales bacterium]
MTNTKNKNKVDYKKTKTDNVAATRDINNFDKKTGNIYESLVILSKRANQIASDIKEELNDKIQEFSINHEMSDEIFENKEQIELARYYEQLPKPSLLAIQEFLDDQIYYRLPEESAKNESIQ